ncbi:ribose-phosphate diphosphokinase [Pseudomonas benzenivorans]|uniref:ribose-phosphate diphosphokinase n=1 Tax=Pseudomonas benzenivorans TaxID=556533 RepID=A0ABY5H6B9_9PSED|nr:ribose-phosphate diphosphokinase [Pseudomonas benzenivorans]UTW07861.1 ribose-phosphate pyrophosphokinase [Pseudomonas benzenivorans]
MACDQPLLFALNGSQDYAARVALRLGLRLAEHEEREFEDGERKCRALEPVNGRQTLVFHGLYADGQQSVHDKLCQLLFFCAGLKDSGARRVQVVAPYLCYARNERRCQPQDPVISRYVATLFEACGVDRLLTLEVHDRAAFDNAFRIPTQHLCGAELFAAHFAGLVEGNEVVAVSPDAGGVKRAEAFRRALEARLRRPVGSALMEKHRDNDQISGCLLVGEVRDRTVIIVDDLISTGDTLLRAGEACRAAGARCLYAAAVHGLFTGGSALLERPLFERIVVCDSVPPFRLEPAVVTRRLDILDTSAAVANCLADDYRLALAGART